MPAGSVTEYIDVAQLVLYGFWIFFAGLIYYLHQENKREGYPLMSDRSGRVKVQGFPPIPGPKTYTLASGATVTVPRASDPQPPLPAEPTARHLGAPLAPTGDPMAGGVGPGSHALRADTPDRTLEGTPRIVPLRVAAGFGVAAGDTDPRGLPVVGADGVSGGTLCELWVDRSEMIFRYFEVAVPGAARSVLLPVNFARVDGRRVKVASVLGAQFARVPTTKSTDQVTLLEEERIMAYYGGGTLYAHPSRAEPLL